MTLLEAFRALSPDTDGNPTAAAAFEVVYEELERLSRRFTFDDGIREDAFAETAMNMLYGGSRTSGALECDSDARVRGFLRRSFYHMAVQLWRARRSLAEDTIDDGDHPIALVDLALSAEEALTQPDLMREALAIEQRFVEQVVPACAETFKQPQARRDFVVAVTQMRALAYKTTTIDDVVLEATGRTGAAAEATVHKRHQRARVRLADFIAAEAAAGRLTAEEADRLRGCVSFLHRRASSAKEAARAAQREQR
ncbi:hypothetical protein TBR22_A46760 [Luteitalea sp. TBR-22]|uniref:hypothetical protein n=1 Tax=Luteitalea sp. TBR-22 TaxID=2802971 RepID=UPI001AF96279|nr:hypothetical protein [Luteitalea sp. TBR-22]BCS35449.1 hypothetical protein TBR22_A46760 [Luteitalea sp. TBR-22]